MVDRALSAEPFCHCCTDASNYHAQRYYSNGATNVTPLQTQHSTLRGAAFGRSAASKNEPRRVDDVMYNFAIAS